MAESVTYPYGVNFGEGEGKAKRRTKVGEASRGGEEHYARAAAGLNVTEREIEKMKRRGRGVGREKSQSLALGGASSEGWVGRREFKKGTSNAEEENTNVRGAENKGPVCGVDRRAALSR